MARLIWLRHKMRLPLPPEATLDDGVDDYRVCRAFMLRFKSSDIVFHRCEEGTKRLMGRLGLICVIYAGRLRHLRTLFPARWAGACPAIGLPTPPRAAPVLAITVMREDAIAPTRIKTARAPPLKSSGRRLSSLPRRQSIGQSSPRQVSAQSG